MKSRSGKEIEIYDVGLKSIFDNEKYEGFKLNWDSNIGFGEMTFFKDKRDENPHWKVDTECMSDNEDKEFIKLVLLKFADKIDVVE